MGKGKRADAAKRRTESKNSNKGKIVVITLVILVIAVLIGVIIYLLVRSPEEEVDNRATIITEDNVDEVMAKMEEPIEDGYYTCEMNVDWNFTDSSQPSYNAYVANSDINTRTVYFDLALEEDNTVVFSSPYIPVGEKLDEIVLTEDLAAGDYPAVVTYHLVDDDHKELSRVSVTVTLHIEQ